MTINTIPETVLFPDLFDKPLVATFDRRHASSDGGAVLLKAAERVYGLVAGFARCLVDRREPGKIRHTLAELLGQRIFGIACGHPDGNDANHLADDPIHKLLLGRDPVAGEALASQPTNLSVRERCRPLRPLRAGDASWRCGSSSGISTGWTGGRGGSRSTWIRPTTRRTAPSSSPSSTGTTIAGATCRCWRF